jgi:hypothetical protein
MAIDIEPIVYSSKRQSSQATWKENPSDVKSIEKKAKIFDEIVGQGTQLSILATVVEQLADKAGLDTPEYFQAKSIWAKIKAELEG